MKESEIIQLIRSEITALKNASIVNKTTNIRSLDNYFRIESRATEEGEVINDDTLGKIPKYIKNELDKRFSIDNPKGEVLVFYADELNKLFNDKEGEEVGSVIILLKNNHNEIIEKLTAIENKLNELDTSKLDSISNSVSNLVDSFIDFGDSINSKLDSIQDSINSLGNADTGNPDEGGGTENNNDNQPT